MFYLNGPELTFKSLLALTANESGAAENMEQLRERYIDFSVSIGGECVRPLDSQTLYCFDNERILELVSKYKDYSQLTDIETDASDTSHASRLQAMAAVDGCRKKLQRTHPELHDFFSFIVHTMFYHRSYESGGGSVSSAPGVIWCAHRTDWSEDDLAEFLVHEMTHILMFIDERRHQHYYDFDEIAKPENYARSAVLMRQRPLDKVFHSLLVSHEVLSFRCGNGEPGVPIVHPKSGAMLSAAYDTIGSIRAVPALKSLVTPRLLALLDQAEASFGKISERLRAKEAA